MSLWSPYDRVRRFVRSHGSITLTPVAGSGPGGEPAAISRISQRYDGCTSQAFPLKPGWRYEVRLAHSGSDPAYTGTPKPDYDYTLAFNPQPANVLLDDPQGLFGVHNWDSGAFLAADKVAVAFDERMFWYNDHNDLKKTRWRSTP